jgi:hypothetical protein
MNNILGIIVLTGLITVVYSIIFAFPVMWLWNSLMPDLLGAKQIGVLDAVVLNILSGLLFRTYYKASLK